MTRNGKIARLPKTVRDTLNARLRDGEPGKRLVAWLNTVPEVRAVLAAEFAARPITENNLSEWKTGGFREWELQQESLERARSLTEHADELRATAGALADHLAVVLTVRYAAALAEWDGDPEAGNGKKLRVLRALCEDVVELRRGDHSAARLKLEQERRAEERERTEEEIVAHFQEWVKRSAIREVILAEQMTPEQMEARFREIFGLSPKAPPAAEGPTEDKREVNANPDIEPNRTGGADPKLKPAAGSDAPTAAEAQTTPPESGGEAAHLPQPENAGTGSGRVKLIRPNPAKSDRPGSRRRNGPMAGL